jgi:hypothetical protein
MTRAFLGSKPKLLICALTALLAAAPVIADQGDCGQPLSTGGGPTATDALYVLRTGVGLASCQITVCDIDGSCAITAGDALRVLAIATGQQIELDCTACGATTTTTTSTTSTTTSTVPAPAATWSDVRAILSSAGCAASGCHGSSSPSGGLGSITNENTGYNELLNEDVACVGSFYQNRVVPFEPDESFLLAKLRGLQDCGSRMPLVGSLSQDDIQAIRSWIVDGAPKN